jgi:hypothetical protein
VMQVTEKCREVLNIVRDEAWTNIQKMHLN